MPGVGIIFNNYMAGAFFSMHEFVIGFKIMPKQFAICLGPIHIAFSKIN